MALKALFFPGSPPHEQEVSLHSRGILVKKVIFIEKGFTFVMHGHQEKNDVTIEIICGF